MHGILSCVWPLQYRSASATFAEGPATRAKAAAAAADDQNAILGCHLLAHLLAFGSSPANQPEPNSCKYEDPILEEPPSELLDVLPLLPEQLFAGSTEARSFLAEAHHTGTVASVRDECLRLSSSDELKKDLIDVLTGTSSKTSTHLKLLCILALDHDAEVCAQLGWSAKVCSRCVLL